MSVFSVDICLQQENGEQGLERIDRKSSWFGLTYGIGMCYAERSICKNGNRRVICLFCVLKYVVKVLALAMGSVKRIAWRKEGERRDGREKGREN